MKESRNVPPGASSEAINLAVVISHLTLMSSVGIGRKNGIG